ncbi:protein translocase subunit SecD [candidate division WWE3 bacterium]|nr:protein translocase subunit SecD [candidate division WWE3 bacterium]
MKHQSFWLWITFFVATISLLMVLPRIPIKIDKTIGSLPIKIDTVIGDYDINVSFLGFRFKRDLKFQPGLDLQGGVRVVMEANLKDIPQDRHDIALNSVKQVIERRVNFLGVTEPNIYTSKIGDQYRVVVELPGVTDTKQVVDIIGQTAQLEFREAPADKDVTTLSAKPEDWNQTDLNGKFLERADVVFDPTTGSPLVQLSFNGDGAKLFEEITGRNIDKPLAIFLDQRLLTAPRVQSAISGGQATIQGQFSVEEANNLVVQLNAGALPVPVSIVQQKNIGPTLGQEAIQKSVLAGCVGLFLVALFMIINYGLFGIFAIVALVIYGLMTLAIYKFVPVTLTLSGIAGFILSIGLAVDASILIFERIREELRMGKSKRAAINLGFTRAWDSIRDANLASVITVFVLFNPFDWNFLVTSGTVRGFALTLGIGIALGLFTGVLVLKSLIYSFYPMPTEGGKKS